MGCDIICFFKQKTAYEMRISDWRSDVCSSDLLDALDVVGGEVRAHLDDDAAGLQLQVKSVLQVGGLSWQCRRARQQDCEQQALQIGRASCRERVCQYV